MEGMAEAAAVPPVPLQELVLTLEQATHMAKQLPATTDPTHLLQIYTSLHQAHHHLSNFLSKTHQQQFPPPPLPSLLPLPHAAAENSVSSATGGADTDPMQLADDDGEDTEGNSKGIIEKVEEKMRDCFIKNKRPKRPLSPSAATMAEERRLYDDGFGRSVKGFDPYATRLRALDLVYQFHGWRWRNRAKQRNSIAEVSFGQHAILFLN